MKRRPALVLLIVATVLWGLAGAASCVVLMFVPLLFDPPGSSTDVAAWLLAASVVVFPASCVVSIVASWIAFRKSALRGALLFTLLPLLPVAGAMLAMVGHEALCGAGLGG